MFLGVAVYRGHRLLERRNAEPDLGQVAKVLGQNLIGQSSSAEPFLKPPQGADVRFAGIAVHTVEHGRGPDKTGSQAVNPEHRDGRQPGQVNLDAHGNLRNTAFGMIGTTSGAKRARPGTPRARGR